MYISKTYLYKNLIFDFIKSCTIVHGKPMEKWIDTVGLKGRAKQPGNWRTNTGSLES